MNTLLAMFALPPLGLLAAMALRESKITSPFLLTNNPIAAPRGTTALIVGAGRFADLHRMSSNRAAEVGGALNCRDGDLIDDGGSDNNQRSIGEPVSFIVVDPNRRKHEDSIDRGRCKRDGGSLLGDPFDALNEAGITKFGNA